MSASRRTVREVVKKSDPWQLLGIKKGASPKEIKLAFQKKAMRVHPDAPGGCGDKFMALQKAHEAVKEAEATVARVEQGLSSSSVRQGARVDLERGEKKRPRNSRLAAYMQKHRYDSKGTVEMDDEGVLKMAMQNEGSKSMESPSPIRMEDAQGGIILVGLLCLFLVAIKTVPECNVGQDRLEHTRLVKSAYSS